MRYDDALQRPGFKWSTKWPTRTWKVHTGHDFEVFKYTLDLYGAMLQQETGLSQDRLLDGIVLLGHFIHNTVTWKNYGGRARDTIKAVGFLLAGATYTYFRKHEGN